jgi:hypothetical protein
MYVFYVIRYHFVCVVDVMQLLHPQDVKTECDFNQLVTGTGLNKAGP